MTSQESKGHKSLPLLAVCILVAGISYLFFAIALEEATFFILSVLMIAISCIVASPREMLRRITKDPRNHSQQ